MTEADNPRAVLGANNPPPEARAVTDRMALDYAALTPSTAALLERARGLPETVEDETTHGLFGSLIVDLRDAERAAESHRQKEKDPYLRAGEAVDGFFKGFIERMEKARKVLKRRDDDYVARKIAAERAERERVRQEAERAERAARDAEREAAAKAEAARIAAERARKPEHVETKTEVAKEAEAVADGARVDRMLAEAATDQARVAAAQKPADLARTRFEDTGRLSTAKQEPFVEITDASKLDMAALWPFIKEDEKLRALKAWAKTVSHKKQMDGAVIEMRDVGVWR